MTDAPSLDTVEALRESLLRDALSTVLATVEGKRVLLWLLAECGIYGQLYTADPASTNFQLGKRDIGIRIVAKLDAMNRIAYPSLLLDAVNLETAFEELHARLDDQSD